MREKTQNLEIYLEIKKGLELFCALWYTVSDLNHRNLITNMASLDSPSRRHQEVWLSANRLKVNQF